MNLDAGQLSATRLPRYILWIVLLLSVLPLALTLAGADFGVTSATAPGTGTHGAYHQLSGALIHTMFEWMAVSIALFTAILALLHYAEKGEVSTPILGLALFVAGAIDSYHILGADRLVHVQGAPDDFMAITWLISRTFLGASILVGAMVFPMTEPTLNRDNRRRGFVTIVLAAAALSAIAFASVHSVASREVLPIIVHTEGWLHRPWNLLPAGLFLLLGIYALPTFYLWRAGVFTHALIVSMIPHCLAELHMALGSGEAFDHHFVLAHFLKVLAYSVPLVGLMLDYRVSQGLQLKSEEDRAGEYFVRKQTEEALARDRTILRILLKEIDHGVMIKDASSRIIRVNDALSTMLGLQGPHDAVGRTENDLWEAGAAAEQDQSVIASGTATSPQTAEVVIGSNRRTLETTRLPLKNQDGTVVGIVAIFRDVS